MVSVTAVVRGLATLGAGLLVVILLGLLITEGLTASRVALFGIICIASVIGGIGVIAENAAIAGVAGLMLLLLDFWQAAIGIFVVPVGLLLLASSIMFWV